MTRTKALVVSGDEIVTQEALIALSAYGIPADAAHSATKAIARMRENYYRVVVADIMFGGLIDIEWIGCLKRINPMTQVVVLTETASSELLIDCVAQGANDFFSKSGDPELLVDAVDQALLRAERWMKLAYSKSRSRAGADVGANR